MNALIRYPRIVLAAVVSWLVHFDARSQDLPKPIISEFEILGGLQISEPFTPGRHGGTSPLYGACVNVGFIHHFADRFAGSLNLQYESKGMRLDYMGENYDYTPPAPQRTVQDTKIK